MSFLTSLLALLEPLPVLLDVDDDDDGEVKLDFLGVEVSISIFFVCLLLPRQNFFLQIEFDFFFRKICEYIHNIDASLCVQTM